MRHILQRKYTDAEWANFIHHPERENDWEDVIVHVTNEEVKEFKSKEDGEGFLKAWGEIKHKPKGILYRVVER
jgi:hypothetical protein